MHQWVHMHRLGELALEAYEQADQSMLLCRLGRECEARNLQPWSSARGAPGAILGRSPGPDGR
eukprot:5300090-Amphidinium_carterae.2